jgi:hypothetical protein
MIQSKLTVSTPGDEYEQEADRVAEQVVRTPTATLQRACACGGGCPRCEARQLSTGANPPQLKRRQPSGTATPSFIQETLNSPGQPLDAETRAFFEPRFEHDFSHVRLHTSESAAQSARALDARAYTAGSNIVFGDGKYAPETTEGKELLAHELAHVVQQGSIGANPIKGPVRHAGGLDFIKRRVERCQEWTPVNDAVVIVLISAALRRFHGNTRLAFEAMRNVRNLDEHCCDLNYAAADHYLFIMSDAGGCALATAWLGLSSVGRSPTLIVAGSQMHVQPLGSAIRTGNCPVSPLNLGVLRWEKEAVDDLCHPRRPSGAEPPVSRRPEERR